MAGTVLAEWDESVTLYQGCVDTIVLFLSNIFSTEVVTYTVDSLTDKTPSPSLWKFDMQINQYRHADQPQEAEST